MNAFSELLVPEGDGEVPDRQHPDCQTHCSNSCNEAFNGYCNDGGAVSDPYTPDHRESICPYGTDCADCGERYGRRLLEDGAAVWKHAHSPIRSRELRSAASSLVRAFDSSVQKRKLNEAEENSFDAYADFTFEYELTIGLWETCLATSLGGKTRVCSRVPDDHKLGETYGESRHDRIFAAQAISLIAVGFGMASMGTAFMSQKCTTALLSFIASLCCIVTYGSAFYLAHCSFLILTSCCRARGLHEQAKLRLRRG
jgi:hypothetical protein